MKRVKLTERQYDLIRLLVSMPERNLKLSLEAALKKYYNEEDLIISPYYIAAKGQMPVALVAHLDTVHTIPVMKVYHDVEEGVLWSPEGIGADDRAGVFSILEILGKGYRPSVIFCCKEEVGGVGAGHFVMENPEPFKGVKYLIELDRQGEEDSVYYRCDNPLFEQMINAYGFNTEWGSFSDISIIAPSWGLCAVNLSIGYYDEHSLGETWHYRQTLKTIDKVCKILEDSLIDDCEYVYIQGKSIWEKFGLEDLATDNYCVACGKDIPEELTITMKDKDGVFTFCPGCGADFLSFCDVCHEPYLEIDKHICGGLTV